MGHLAVRQDLSVWKIAVEDVMGGNGIGAPAGRWTTFAPMPPVTLPFPEYGPSPNVAQELQEAFAASKPTPPGINLGDAVLAAALNNELTKIAQENNGVPPSAVAAQSNLGAPRLSRRHYHPHAQAISCLLEQVQMQTEDCGQVQMQTTEVPPCPGAGGSTLLNGQTASLQQRLQAAQLLASLMQPKQEQEEALCADAAGRMKKLAQMQQAAAGLFHESVVSKEDTTRGELAKDNADDRLDDTLRVHLQKLQGVDPACVLVVRRINRLGFDSPGVLETHFQQFGPVAQVLVSHSQVRTPNRPCSNRMRPSNIGFLAMERPEDALAIVAQGEAHVVAGHSIRVSYFESRARQTVTHL